MTAFLLRLTSIFRSNDDFDDEMFSFVFKNIQWESELCCLFFCISFSFLFHADILKKTVRSKIFHTRIECKIFFKINKKKMCLQFLSYLGLDFFSSEKMMMTMINVNLFEDFALVEFLAVVFNFPEKVFLNQFSIVFIIHREFLPSVRFIIDLPVGRELK